MEDLSNCRYGGLLPGSKFLEVLKTSHPEIKIKTIKDICIEENRNDIVLILKPWNDNDYLWESFSEYVALSELASKLEIRDFWEILADEFSFDDKVLL